MIGVRTPTPAYGAAPRVNLLPPAERERRERVALIRRWASIAVAAAVVVALVVLVAALRTRSAHQHLADERARTTALAGQLATYRDVSAATRDRASYQAYRTRVMATDVSWGSVLGALQATLPGGAAITGFNAVVDTGSAGATRSTGTSNPGSAAGSAAASAAAPAGTAVTVTLDVTTKRPPDQQAIVAGFAKTPGVLGVDLSSLSSESYPRYTSTTVVFFDDSVFSGKYARKSP
jgi:hypothetical protein